ncbi:MAG: SEC-C metal-binding domain-containing protein [Betaproteobacteria bacterium]
MNEADRAAAVVLGDFEALLESCVARILSSRDERAFSAWLAATLDERAPAGCDPQFARSLAYSLGRSIWNVVPLPWNGFRPTPLPAPGRNDACPCGSGAKFKRCCARLPELPVVDPEVAWYVTLKLLSGDEVLRALRECRVPPARPALPDAGGTASCRSRPASGSSAMRSHRRGARSPAGPVACCRALSSAS